MSVQTQQLKTCDFCRKLFKPSQYNTNPNRLIYCKLCARSNGVVKPRFMEQIEGDQIYMKGVFESFVAEVEQSPAIFGMLNFDKLYNHITFHHKYLTDSEYADLLDILFQYERRWGEYIDLVLNQSMYTEISSSGGVKKSFKTPSDWAAAIRNLLRILSDTNNAIKSQLDIYIGDAGRLSKKNMCQKRTVSKCSHPCKVRSKLGIKYCTY